MLGALAGLVLAVLFLRGKGFSATQSLLLLLPAAASFLAGARLFNVLVNPDMYHDVADVLRLQMSGLSLYGGILGAFMLIALWAASRKECLWPILDALVLPSGIAFALARIGCYLNGCCRGIRTDLWVGVVFPETGADRKISSIFSVLVEPVRAVYPTQLFEMGLALIGLIPAMILYRRGKSKAGTVFLLYGIWFCLMRLLVLPLRSLPYSDTVTRVFLPAFYLSLILIGTVLLLVRRSSFRAGKKEIE